MAILSKGTDFSTGDQVTAANLDALVDSATFASGAVDNTTTALDSSSPQKIIVKDGGIGTTQLATSDSTTTGVTFAKMQYVAANTVLVRDANSEGNISAKAVTDTQILIGDGTGFTAAALSGDATMTNAGAVTIANDAVTNAKLADDAVDTAQINNNAVTTAQIANSSSTTTGVTFAKMQHVPANTVLVNDTNAEGDISAKAVADTQILIGDGTGFTAAALSGDVTMTNSGAVTIAANAVEGSMILSSTTLQNGVKCADQSASDNSTKIANTKYVDAQCNLIPTPAIVTTTDARNSEGQRYFKNLTEATDPNSIISINSGVEIQFASTGTYLVKAGVALQDNDTTPDDKYNIALVPNSSSTTAITYGGQDLEVGPSSDESGVLTNFIFAYAVTNTGTNKLSIYARPIDQASSSNWEGVAAIEITKIA